jgi:glutamate-5-semialdehyde dehydrogenase
MSTSFLEQLSDAQHAARSLRLLSTEEKSKALESIAQSIADFADDILDVNMKEVDEARNDLDASQLDRLRLDHDRIESIVKGTRSVAHLDDPIDEILEEWDSPSGVHIKKVRVPLGVVAVIYENRPNVTVDSAAICLMSSNACVLRGSSAARKTNSKLIEAIHAGLDAVGIDRSAVTFIDDPSREGAKSLMQAKGYIDVLIPRGGPSLINAVEADATVPTIIDGAGNCHVYIDKDANLDMALAVAVNSKTQRTSVCNAAESIVLHRDIARDFLPNLVAALKEKGVVIVGDQSSQDISPEIEPASEDDFAAEFLDLKVSITIVDSLDDAVAHINKYSTGHTESIITDNDESAEIFSKAITSAVVMRNTSTRFTDGERFGFGAEIGISTQKLHARGPMALRELTTYQYQVESNGATV